MDLQFLARLMSIIVINFTLSGDNAIVIAMAVRTLPRKQQKLGILWGTVAAIVLRVILTFVAAKILSIPFFQAAGGLLLIYIAIKLTRQEPTSEEDVKQGTNLMEAIKIIIIADLIMSTDNVLAVAAASVIDGRVNLPLLLFGLGLSMPILMIGAAFIATLMGKYPWLVQLGAGILGWISGEMLVKDPFIHSRILPYYSTLKWVAPITLAVGILVIGWLLSRRAAAKEAANKKDTISEQEAV
jgi:YjbE family integral membrane protein